MAPPPSALLWNGFALFLSRTLLLQQAHAAKPNLALGTPSTMICSSDTPARVFYGTSVGEIAAIKQDGGYAQWQNKDHEDRTPIRLLRTYGSMLMAGSEGGTVHMLNAKTGATHWERQYKDRIVDVFAHGPTTEFNTIVTHESGIQSRSYAGDHKWGVFPAALGKPSARFIAAALTEGGSTVCALANDTEGSGMLSMKIDVRTGEVSQQEDVPSVVVKAIGSSFIVVSQHIAYIQRETLNVFPICGSGMADTYNLKPLRTKPPRLVNRLQPWLRTENVFTMTNGAFTFIFRIAEDGLKMARVENAPGVVGVIQGDISGAEQPDHVAVALQRGQDYEVKFVNVVGQHTERERIIRDHNATEHGLPSWIAVCGLKGDMQINIGSEDHMLVSIRGLKPTWTLSAGHTDVKRFKSDHPHHQSGHYEEL